jgi:hypothetical protein
MSEITNAAHSAVLMKSSFDPTDKIAVRGYEVFPEAQIIFSAMNYPITLSPKSLLDLQGRLFKGCELRLLGELNADDGISSDKCSSGYRRDQQDGKV